MRIVFVALDFKPRHGGVAELTHRLALELHAAGDDVTVLARAAPGAAAFDGAVPYRIVRSDAGLDDPSRLARVREISDAVQRVDGEVLVVNHLEPLGVHGLLAARWRRLPLVLMTHGTEVNRRDGHGGGSRAILSESRGRFWKGVALRGATVVTCSSRFTADRVIRWGVAPGRVRVVHPGADPVEEGDCAGRRGAWRAHLGVPPEAPLALFLGRLIRRKGPDVLVRAFAEARTQAPGALLLVVGDGPMRAELRTEAEDMGLSSSVRFLGEVNEEEKEGLLCATDVLALPSREMDDGDVEGFGIVLLEAAARGIPTLAGRSGGIPEAVEDGRTGLLVDGASASEVAEGLGVLLSDPERARLMGSEARERVRNEASWSAAGAAFRAACREAIAFPVR